jgi:hypothetical protein
MLFKWLVLGKGGVDDVGHGPAGSSDNAVSVAMEHWNVENRVFAVEQFFFRNSDSVVTVQRLFRRKFSVHHRGAIPDRNTILRWVEAFRTTGSVISGVPSNFFRGGSTNSVEDRGQKTGIWGAVAPQSGVLEAAVIWYKKFHFI